MPEKNEAPWPDQLVAWQDLPIEVRRYLTKRLLEKSLFLHDGVAGMVKFLYAGSTLAGLTVAQTYGMKGHEFWPFIVQDTRAWLASRASRSTGATNG